MFLATKTCFCVFLFLISAEGIAENRLSLWQRTVISCSQFLSRLVAQRSPQWPNGRSLARYNQLIGTDIAAELAEGGVWIDVGCGRGIALAELEAMQLANVSLVGINVHRVPMPRGVKQIFAHLPKDHSVSWLYHGQVRLVTDLYGAVSYSSNPLEALVYESSLLRYGDGRAFIITELERFGSPTTWHKIRSFYHEYLGQEIQFQPIRIFADANQKWETALRIVISGASHCDDLRVAFSAARTQIGKPKRGETLWQSPDGRAQIRAVDYRQN